MTAVTEIRYVANTQIASLSFIDTPKLEGTALRVGKLVTKGYRMDADASKQGHVVLVNGKYRVELKSDIAEQATLVKKSEPASGWDDFLDLPPVDMTKYTMFDGLYTIVFGDKSHVTLKVETGSRGKWKGTRFVSYLRGADNTKDYTTFATIQANERVTIYKAFLGNQRLDDALRGLQSDPRAAGETYAMRSGRCCRCGRVLTVPASLHRGLGPECAKIRSN